MRNCSGRAFATASKLKLGNRDRERWLVLATRLSRDNALSLASDIQTQRAGSWAAKILSIWKCGRRKKKKKKHARSLYTRSRSQYANEASITLTTDACALTASDDHKGEYRAKYLNWTKLTQFDVWRSDQRTSKASSLVIGWRVRARSHVVTYAVRRCLL